MQAVIVIGVVSAALVAGAVWGIYGPLFKDVEGFIVAVAGGALILSAVLELIEPATEQSGLPATLALVLLGALVFTGLDFLVKSVWGSESGGGLLVAITLDGIPENLALGVALIGASPIQVAALSGSIFLSNLPEAAGGAKEMTEGGRSDSTAMALWGATALILSGAAVAGNTLLAGESDAVLGLIRCFAGGAVIASLATEVFPKAYKEDSYWAGIATAIGFVLALYLNSLA